MKLSSLTPTDKIKLAAEMDGYVKHPQHSYYYRNGDVNGERLTDSFSDLNGEYCPKYATSYDAIIPLIQKLCVTDNDEEKFRGPDHDPLCLIFDKYLCEMFPTKGFSWQATPSQLLDALLVATGKAEL